MCSLLILFLSARDTKPNVFGSKNKTELEKVTNVIINCGRFTSQIVILKHILKVPALPETYDLIKSR